MAMVHRVLKNYEFRVASDDFAVTPIIQAVKLPSIRISKASGKLVYGELELNVLSLPTAEHISWGYEKMSSADKTINPIKVYVLDTTIPIKEGDDMHNIIGVYSIYGLSLVGVTHSGFGYAESAGIRETLMFSITSMTFENKLK